MCRWSCGIVLRKRRLSRVIWLLFTLMTRRSVRFWRGIWVGLRNLLEWFRCTVVMIMRVSREPEPANWARLLLWFLVCYAEMTRLYWLLSLHLIWYVAVLITNPYSPYFTSPLPLNPMIPHTSPRVEKHTPCRQGILLHMVHSMQDKRRQVWTTARAFTLIPHALKYGIDPNPNILDQDCNR